MFPTLQVSLTGLDPSLKYSLMVDLTCIDNKRYRYAFHQSKWIVAGPGDKFIFKPKFKNCAVKRKMQVDRL